jgi:hypothetical protein
MKAIIKKFIGVSIFLLSLNANAGLIYLEESAKTSDSISVNLMGSGFNEGLATGSFFASWDSSLLEYASITFNESLYDFVNYVNYIDQASGYLDDGLFSALSGVDAAITTGDFEIATFTFTILAEGESFINVTQGSDSLGLQPYYDPSFTEIINLTFTGTMVDTNVSVPEPSTFVVLALGMFCLLSRQLLT